MSRRDQKRAWLRLDAKLAGFTAAGITVACAVAYASGALSFWRAFTLLVAIVIAGAIVAVIVLGEDDADQNVTPAPAERDRSYFVERPKRRPW